MAYGFYFDMTACVGCKTCQMACKDKNNLDVGTLFRSVKDYETGMFPNPGLFHLTMSCNHCDNPACIAACPVGAMYKDEETGVVLHDDELCIGCQSCVAACPYSQPKFMEELGIVQKCDSCIGIRQAGGECQCVASCPMRALEFGDMDELMEKHPDAIRVSELPFMGEDAALTEPNFLVSAKDAAMEEAVMKEF